MPEFARVLGGLNFRPLGEPARSCNCTAVYGTVRLAPGDRMNSKDTFWMACDSTEQLRAEYGPFHTREEAEREARKLGFGYLLRYEHIIGEDDEIEEVRCVFVELQDSHGKKPGVTFHTRCASCGETATHEMGWQAEVWADIHEFEHMRHKVRLFEHSRGEGLREIADWRSAA